MSSSVRKLIRYKDIILYRTAAGIKSEARQNYLGYLWFLFEPMLSAAVLYLALTKITGQKGPEYIAFLLLGLIAWQWFESAIAAASMSIREKYGTLIQFNLPKYLFPVVTVLINTWKFAVAFLVILCLMPWLGFPPNWRYLELPVIMFVQLLLIVGLAIPIALTLTFFSDLRAIVSSAFRLRFYLSGVFFKPELVPPELRRWFFANPMADLIDSYRQVVLDDAAPNGRHLAYAASVAIVLLAVGAIYHRLVDKRILKQIRA